METFSPKEIMLWRWISGLWHFLVGVFCSYFVFLLLRDANVATNISSAVINYALAMFFSVPAGLSFLCAVEKMNLQQYKYKLDEYIVRWQQYKHKDRPMALFVFCVIWAIERVGRSACFVG
jgi:hypothetical protein